MTKTLDPQMLDALLTAWTDLFLAWAPIVDIRALRQAHSHALLSAIGVDPPPPPAEGTYSQMAEADQRGRNFLVGCAMMLLEFAGSEDRPHIQNSLHKFLEGQPTVSILLALDPVVHQLLPRNVIQLPVVLKAEAAYKQVREEMIARCLPAPKPLDDDEDQ